MMQSDWDVDVGGVCLEYIGVDVRDFVFVG